MVGRVEHFIQDLENSPLADRIAHHERIPHRAGEYADFPGWLQPMLAEGLREQGIERLYGHQARALEAVAAGKNISVATGAASGKSLCYHLPVLQAILEDPASRALYLFPTKALAQDQLHSLRKLAGWDIAAATYDGDTHGDQRSAIRKTAQDRKSTRLNSSHPYISYS